MRLSWLWAVALTSVLCACETEDTGKLCGDPNENLSATPIVGENPVVEVVRLDRDARCETFQCLTHKGLDAYCTRGCTYDKPTAKNKACVADSDCVAPQHCNAGICNNDDCPKGFWCRGVQDVGPTAGQQFCVRRDKCNSDFDCGDIGSMVCKSLGCHDACLKSPDTCSFHQYVCDPQAELGCKCADGSAKCADAALTCKPPDAAQSFPAGSVAQVGVCLPKS